jgi:UDP-2,3-diacylglucosamine pyrophosphatase LpxH
LFISDVHLGSKTSQAEELLAFLQQTRADTLYLVGDIVDGWALRRSWHWPNSHNEVMQEVLRLAREGTRVVYVPGNHDAAARPFGGYTFGGILIAQEALHILSGGYRALILHGDAFDGIVRHARWLSMLGAVAYDAALQINRGVGAVRGWLGLPYWSFSAYLKQHTKRAVQFIADFEAAVAKRAATSQADVVVCGHIHVAEIRRIGGVVYVNAGDWVESLTAVGETADGTLELLRWKPQDQEAVVAERYAEQLGSTA